MQIKLSGAGKRFNRDWIFRQAHLQFNSGVSYAITGPNGSGKSTLLQTIGGTLQLSEGSIAYSNSHGPIAAEKAYEHISFCAPYMDVIEEMTLTEFFTFHNAFKPFITGIDVRKAIQIVGLQSAGGKQIRYYSSGMKQRVKLAQAILTGTAVVLLDEPCSNLDVPGIELYHALVAAYCKDRIVIVCSNDPVEYSFCREVISITAFKETAPTAKS